MKNHQLCGGSVCSCVGSGAKSSVGAVCQAVPDLGKNELVWGLYEPDLNNMSPWLRAVSQVVADFGWSGKPSNPIHHDVSG